MNVDVLWLRWCRTRRRPCHWVYAWRNSSLVSPTRISSSTTLRYFWNVCLPLELIRLTWSACHTHCVVVFHNCCNNNNNNNNSFHCRYTWTALTSRYTVPLHSVTQSLLTFIAHRCRQVVALGARPPPGRQLKNWACLHIVSAFLVLYSVKLLF